MSSTEYKSFTNQEIAYAVGNSALHAIPTSVAKAALIDYPTYVYLGDQNAAYKSSIAFLAYEIRTTINKSVEDLLGIPVNASLTSLVVGGFSGAVGGGLKYYITDQNVVIGMLNNAAYEVCNRSEFCSQNPLVEGAFAIIVESLDATAQTYLNVKSRNVPGAINAAIIGGAKVGFAIYGCVQMFYGPTLDATPKVIQAVDDNFPEIAIYINNAFIGNSTEIDSEL